MNTFLPYEDFKKSAQVLDMRRLGKQRVEAWQILQILNGNNKDSNWRNHPAVLMWESWTLTLALYGLRICEEWIKRGYKDTLANKFMVYLDGFELSDEDYKPWWFGQEAFHLSHRSNLLRKDHNYYSKQFEVGLIDTLPYVWPVRLINGEKILWKP